MNTKTNEVDYPAPVTAGYLFANVDNTTEPPTITYDWRTVSGNAKPVTISLPAGTYNKTQTVELSTSESDVTIYYTTDGTNPDTTSTQYMGPITVASAITLKAIAASATLAPSTVSTAVYSITRRLILRSESSSEPVRYSDDNGSTWTNSIVTNPALVSYLGYNCIIGANHQYGVGSTGYGMLRSTDRGLTWKYEQQTYFGAINNGNGTQAWNQTYGRQVTECNGKLFLFGFYNRATKAPNAGVSFFFIGTSLTGTRWKWVPVASGSDASSNTQSICNKLTSEYVKGPVVAYRNGIYIVAVQYGVYRSTDDCVSWTYIKPAGWSSNFGSDGHVHSTSAGFVVSSSNRVFWSADGITWVASTTTANCAGYAMKIDDDKLICGNSSSSSPWSISLDGGKVWSFMETTPQQYSSDISPVHLATNGRTYALIPEDYYYGLIYQGDLKNPKRVLSTLFPPIPIAANSSTKRIVWTGSRYYAMHYQTGGGGYTYPTYTGSDDFLSWTYNSAHNSFSSYCKAVSLRTMDETTTAAVDVQPVTETPVLSTVVEGTALLDHGTLAVDMNTTDMNSNWNTNSDLCYNTTDSLVYYIAKDFYVYSLNIATSVRTKVSSVTFMYASICFNVTDGNLYVGGSSGIFKLTTDGVATKIYTFSSSVNSIVHNPINGFIHFCSGSNLYQINTAGSLQRSSTTKYFTALYFDSVLGLILGNDGNSTIWKISATLTFTAHVTSLVYSFDRFVRLDNEYFIKASSPAIGTSGPGVVRSNLTTVDMIGINYGRDYVCPLVVGTTLYWALGNGILWQPTFTMDPVKTINIDAGLLNPILYYTDDGSDPTPLEEPFEETEQYQLLTNAAHSLKLILTDYSTPDVYRVFNVPLGTTLKFCSYIPTWAPSQIITYVT